MPGLPFFPSFLPLPNPLPAPKHKSRRGGWNGRPAVCQMHAPGPVVSLVTVARPLARPAEWGGRVCGGVSGCGCAMMYMRDGGESFWLCVLGWAELGWFRRYCLDGGWTPAAIISSSLSIISPASQESLSRPRPPLCRPARTRLGGVCAPSYFPSCVHATEPQPKYRPGSHIRFCQATVLPYTCGHNPQEAKK
jgi:hypothetical protein